MNDSAVRRPVVRDLRHDDLVRLVIGLTLVATFWALSWLRVRPFSDHYFFPLWTGYFLTVDAVVALRTGTSPVRRSGLGVVWMFLISVPLWWIFEGFNEFVASWHYRTPADYTTLEYALLASLAFSTVVPALLTTAELVRSFRLSPLDWIPAIRETPARLIAVHLAGWGMVAATALWPRYAFPLVWMAVIYLLDPIATVLGKRSIAWHVTRGDWSPVFNLGLAGVICGFFWEMWNFYSLPKWTYSTPYVEWLHVFEMPLLGYTGYIPFGVEVYVFYLVARWLLPSAGSPEIPVSTRHAIDPVSGRNL